MNKATFNSAILSISLDRSSRVPLQTQLSQALRELAHAGRLTPGSRLPSSRNLAQELAVSRVTTTAVYEQLIAEGYLEGRRGSGVFVASELPDIPIQKATDAPSCSGDPLPPNEPLRPFGLGYPDLAAFPYREWTRIYDRVWRTPSAGVLGQSNPMGFGPLRTAIAMHLREWRGIRCSTEQIVITSGLVEALELFAQAALKPGNRVLVEDPGHQILINALIGSGMVCDPVPVDAQGFCLSRATAAQQNARAIAVTPSRQYPLGVTLPLARRLELLDWAKNHNSFVLEDDYDGEFRYQGQPLPAMINLDNDERGIYIGSFSKVMFPALRLGYMVVPQRLLPLVIDVLKKIGPKAALIAQPVLAEFIMEGAFATHIRRMRRLYSERQKVLLDALRTHTDGLLSADAETGGMHLVASLHADLAERLSDVEVAKRAQEFGLLVAPLSRFFMSAPDQQGLVLAYAAFDHDTLTAAVKKLAVAVNDGGQ